MKQRIMSRTEIARSLIDWRNRRVDGKEMTDAQDKRFEQAQSDFMFYIIADGTTVKIYNDVAHGGTVVDIMDDV